MKPKILIQLDTDPQPSVFDGVTAIDAGVDHLFRHGNVKPEAVRDLVYGGLFTRGLDELHRTAVFVGGSDVSAGEAVLAAVLESYFGPFRMSVLLDSNGANTTAAAAVRVALEALEGSLEGAQTAVLGGTGPVGQRVAHLLARQGANVLIGSRRLERARATAKAIAENTGRIVRPFEAQGPDALHEALRDVALIVSAGASSVTLLPANVLQGLKAIKIVIDLNAVPPLGIEGIEANDHGNLREGVRAWGAIGVGGTKMQIHIKAIEELFTSNDKVLDAEQVFDLGQGIV
ncbi:NADP-dependent methylenetetrahydromethanopterin/methylenetetrahydrofolate dehydrogenase [soil metagenome]